MGYIDDYVSREIANYQNDSSEQEAWTPAKSQIQTPIVSRTLVGPAGSVELTTDPLFTYMGGDGGRYWDSYSPETRARLEGQLVNAGLLSAGGFEPGANNYTQHEAWEEVMGWANYYGVTPFNALARLEREGVATGAGGGGGGGGGSAGPSTVTTIPDYPTIVQNSKEMLRNTMGREMEDWEIELVAQEMQKSYRSQASQMLQAQLAGSGEFEITDPGSVTQAFIEDSYANELDRLSDVGEQGANYKLAMDVFTQGSSMVA